MNKELDSIKIPRHVSLIVSHFTNFVMLRKYAQNGLDSLFKFASQNFGNALQIAKCEALICTLTSVRI